MVCPPLLYSLVIFRDDDELKAKKALTRKKSKQEKVPYYNLSYCLLPIKLFLFAALDSYQNRSNPSH